MRDDLELQRQFFATGATRCLKFRRAALDRLLAELQARRADILEALANDLHKSATESLMSEYLPTILALKTMRRKLKRWAAPRRVGVAAVNFPARGWLVPEPYGVVAIVAAWNYPLLLAMEPLIGALAAGNCAVLRPAPAAAFTGRLLERLIADCFPPEHVKIDQAEPEVLARMGFDYFFFTGGAATGKKVLRDAAESLTPVTLELGGKSPCIVTADADLEVAARRIVWGKFLNAGQTCVAPDYLLVQRQVKDALLLKMRQAITRFFGSNPQDSPDFGRIISDYHFERLAPLVSTGRLIAGGERVAAERYIAPTIIDQIDWDDAVMREEIFGPILPVLEFETLEEVWECVRQRPKPLALYFFSRSRRSQREAVRETSSGAVCINEVVMHLMNPAMPFGGIGNSGMGAYHGRKTFTTFSHEKPVMRRSNWLDWPLRYPPFTHWKKKIVEWLT